MENTKAIFANTINELGSGAVLGAGDCHNFGITWGCAIECPAFSTGRCKDVYFDNIIMFIKDGSIWTDDDLFEVLFMYENKLSYEEIEEIFNSFFEAQGY